ncbi:MAG TPA: hypothetical protein VE990_09110 [Acidimicrobiales bacterium]|nr:hypothetical protein [Acidimicrobiales bacterium]
MLRRRPDAAVVSVFVLGPVLVLGAVALTGHVALPGDDLVQNYPLRVLVGRDLRGLQLPLWNPYIWSGTPLLGGFNAGALFPLTWLFAVLPGPAAWTVGLGATYGLAAGGLYLFLRQRGMGIVASGSAGAAFAAGGFMAAQAVHIGLVEGTSLTGWGLVAVERMGARTERRRERRASLDDEEPPRPPRVVGPGVGLGVVVGLVGLCGDPRALSSVAIVLGLWATYRVAVDSRRGAVVASLVVAAVVGGLIMCGQLVPGLAAQAQSQRAAGSYFAFSAGSLRPSQLSLLAVPFLLGGFASIKLSPYSGDFNLVEITSYIGLLPLAGALGAAGDALRRRGRTWRLRSPRAPRYPEGASAWVAIGVVGAVLALGANLPTGHLLAHVPLYRGQRLQSRNLAVLDTAVAVLFGMWADRFLAGRPATSRRAVGLSLLAPLAVVVIVAASAALGGWARLAWWTTEPIFPRTFPFTAVSLAVAVAVAGVVVAGPSWDAARRRRRLLVVLGVDLAFFVANAAYGWVPISAFDRTGSAAAELARLLPPGGRYAVYSPDQLYGGYTSAALGFTPVPDLNAIDSISSAQGYGSIVGAPYQALTSTHAPGYIDPHLLASGGADQLGLSVVLVDPASTAAVPTTPAEPLGRDLVLAPGASQAWSFAPTAVNGVRVFTQPDGLSDLWFDVVDSSGASQRVPITGEGVALVAPRTIATGARLVNDSGVAVTLTTAELTTPIGPSRLGRPIDQFLTGWRYEGVVGGLLAYLSPHRPNPAWVLTGGRRVPVAAESPATPEMDARGPGILVRAEAWAPGWRALLSPANGGPERWVPVSERGALQSVALPAGSWRVSFRYRPGSVVVGLALFAAGWLTAGAAMVLAALGRGRARRTR